MQHVLIMACIVISPSQQPTRVDVADPEWNTSGVPWPTLYFKSNYAALRVTPSNAGAREAGSSKFATTVAAAVPATRASSLCERTIARTRVPRASNSCSNAEPVFPVAPVTRIRSSARMSFSNRERGTVTQNAWWTQSSFSSFLRSWGDNHS
jgi:hypothetical protein